MLPAIQEWTVRALAGVVAELCAGAPLVRAGRVAGGGDRVEAVLRARGER